MVGVNFIQPKQHLSLALPLQEIADCHDEKPAAAQAQETRGLVRLL
jgi:hypothetical protein